MLVLHAVQPSARTTWEQVVYLTASAVAGIGRILVLRLYVFAARKRAATPVRKQTRPARTGNRFPALALVHPAGSVEPAGAPTLSAA
ncbi:hypothetical protein [Streptomyces humi]